MISQSIIPDFFYLHAIFNLHCEFLYGSTICILVGMISMHMAMFSIPTGVMGIPADTIWIPMGTISKQTLAMDTRL